MPTQTFALVPNGPKALTLSWGAFWKNFTVSVNGQQVATLSSDELKAGKDVALPDGSTLRVHLKQGFGNAGLALTRNGQPLPGASNDPNAMVRNAAYLLYFIAALNAVLGAGVLAFGVKALEQLGFGPVNLALGFIFALAGYFTLQRSLVALVLAMGLYALDYVAGFVMLVAEGGKPGVGGIFIRIFFLIVLARGVTGIRALKAEAATPAA